MDSGFTFYESGCTWDSVGVEFVFWQDLLFHHLPAWCDAGCPFMEVAILSEKKKKDQIWLCGTKKHPSLFHFVIYPHRIHFRELFSGYIARSL
jgi:hypothetical protein